MVSLESRAQSQEALAEIMMDTAGQEQGAQAMLASAVALRATMAANLHMHVRPSGAHRRGGEAGEEGGGERGGGIWGDGMDLQRVRILLNQGSLFRANHQLAAAEKCFRRVLSDLGGIEDARGAAGEREAYPHEARGVRAHRVVVQIKADACNSLGAVLLHKSLVQLGGPQVPAPSAAAAAAFSSSSSSASSSSAAAAASHVQTAMGAGRARGESYESLGAETSAAEAASAQPLGAVRATGDKDPEVWFRRAIALSRSIPPVPIGEESGEERGHVAGSCNLALHLLNLGRAHEAMEEVELALELAPDNQHLQRTMVLARFEASRQEARPEARQEPLQEHQVYHKSIRFEASRQELSESRKEPAKPLSPVHSNQPPHPAREHGEGAKPGHVMTCRMSGNESASKTGAEAEETEACGQACHRNASCTSGQRMMMTWVREQVDALRELLLPNCSRRVDPSLSHAHRLDLCPFLALISVERGGLECVLELRLELQRLVSLTDAIHGDLAGGCEALDADVGDVIALTASTASPSASSSTGPHTALPRPTAPVARHPSLLLLRMQVLMLGARFESQHGSDQTCFARAESFLHRALEEFPGEIDVYKELGGLLLSSRNDGGKAAEATHRTHYYTYC